MKKSLLLIILLVALLSSCNHYDEKQFVGVWERNLYKENDLDMIRQIYEIRDDNTFTDIYLLKDDESDSYGILFSSNGMWELKGDSIIIIKEPKNVHSVPFLVESMWNSKRKDEKHEREAHKIDDFFKEYTLLDKEKNSDIMKVYNSYRNNGL